jgi:hypothetical protein
MPGQAMSECLCPKCGFVWDNQIGEPSDRLKRAVRKHLAGEADSVMGAMMSSPERLAELELVQRNCDAGDLARFKAGEIYSGPIEPGMIFAWAPFNNFAACEVVVLKVDPTADDGKGMIRTRGLNFQLGDYWNELPFARQSIVKSLRKI